MSATRCARLNRRRISRVPHTLSNIDQARRRDRRLEHGLGRVCGGDLLSHVELDQGQRSGSGIGDVQLHTLEVLAFAGTVIGPDVQRAEHYAGYRQRVEPA